MSTTTPDRAGAFAWGSSLLAEAPPGPIDLSVDDRFDIQQVLARYAFARDHADFDELRQVLTDDATWTAHIAGHSQLGPVVGRAAMEAQVRTASNGQLDQRHHNLTNVVFRSADRSQATVWAYLTLTSNAGGTPHIAQTGFYVITLRRSEREWRISGIVLGLDVAL